MKGITKHFRKLAVIYSDSPLLENGYFILYTNSKDAGGQSPLLFAYELKMGYDINLLPSE